MITDVASTTFYLANAKLYSLTSVLLCYKHQRLFLQMPIFWFLHMWVIPWKSVGALLPPAWILFINLLIYCYFFMSETKEDIFLPANPVPIQNKSPESTGIIWDLHRGVQGTALHWWLGRSSPHTVLQGAQTKEGSQQGLLYARSRVRMRKGSRSPHCISCLRKVQQQKNPLLNCMKIKLWIDLKYLDASLVSYFTFCSLAVKWHQQSAHSFIAVHLSLCLEVWGVVVCPPSQGTFSVIQTIRFSSCDWGKIGHHIQKTSALRKSLADHSNRKKKLQWSNIPIMLRLSAELWLCSLSLFLLF